MSKRSAAPITLISLICIIAGCQPSTEEEPEVVVDQGATIVELADQGQDQWVDDGVVASDMRAEMSARPDSGVAPEMGVPLGTPAPLGPPPSLDPEHPLGDLPTVERILPQVLVQSIEHLQWLPEQRLLQFSVGKGSRASVEKLEPEVYEETPQLQEHPYSMWRYQAQTDGDRAWESMRLPAHPVGRGETHWCRQSRWDARIWCHHNFKKGDERLILVTAGDGLQAPVEAEAWGLKGVHAGLYTFDETATGRQYWVYKKGIINAKSWIGMLDPATLAIPSQGGEPLERVSSPCETIAEERVCPVSEDIYGLALSPDDRTLYFTTGGYHSEGSFGAIWHAPIDAQGGLGEEKILVGDVPRARGLTVDSRGNLYVASELQVRVFSPRGEALGSIEVVADEAHREALLDGKKRFTALGVAFGGGYFNELYIGIGFDRKGTENIDGPDQHTLGGLYRVPLKAQAAWAGRHGIEAPE